MKKTLSALMAVGMVFLIYSCDSGVNTAKDKITDSKNAVLVKVDEKVDKNLLNAGITIFDKEVNSNFVKYCNEVVPKELKDNAREVCACAYDKGVSQFKGSADFLNAGTEKLDAVMPALFKDCGVKALGATSGYAFLELCKTELPDAVKDKGVQVCGCAFDAFKAKHPDTAELEKIINNKDVSGIVEVVKMCAGEITKS
jgi:hypothetical protein